MTKEENNAVEEEVEKLPPVIEHFPVRSVERNRPVLPGSEEERKHWKLNRKTALRVSFLGALAALLIYFILMFNHQQIRISNPVDNAKLANLKIEVSKNIQAIENTENEFLKQDLTEKNKELIDEIRKLDLHLRQYYFDLLDRKTPGTWLLFVCMILFFLSFRLAWKFEPDTPTPRPDLFKGLEINREKQLGRASIFFFTVTFFCLGLTLIQHLPYEAGQRYRDEIASRKMAESQVAIDWAALKNHWPYFRARTQIDMDDDRIPVDFDVKTGVFVKWMSSIALPGISSPVVWKNKIFVSGANKGKRALYCYNADTGKRLWALNIKSMKKKEAPEVFEKYMYAASTPATDGRRVYCIFSNGDLVAADLKGKILWQKDFDLPKNAYGHSSSLIAYQGKLMVTWEHRGENSAIMALDGKSGQTIWETSKKNLHESNWRSPICYQFDGRDVFLSPGSYIEAYDMHSGEALWKVLGVEDEIGTSALFVNEMIVTLAKDGALVAIQPGGRGDVTESHVIWSNDQISLPDIPSPVSDGESVWLMDSNTTLTCLDVRTGKLVYEQDLDFSVYASPVILGRKIFICGTKGECLFISTEKTFKVLGKGNLDMGMYTTPAHYKNRLIFRGDNKLVSIAKG